LSGNAHTRSPRLARRALLALGALLFAGLAWLLAPALSAAPYAPPPVDFEQALPPVERVGTAPAPRARIAAAGEPQRRAAVRHKGRVTYRTPVIEAPGRFDVAGIAGEMRPYELRARERGGSWSRWFEAGNGDPVWFGGADELQIRTRGWRPSGRIHYVNVSGDSTLADAALTAARRAVSSAVIAAASLLGSQASAQPPKPAFITRRQWGANGPDGCPPRRKPDRGKVRAAVVHHTVNRNDYSEAEAPAMVLAICRFHRNGNKWDDIGYNALVDRFGNVYQGRAGGMVRPVVGAHAQGFNAVTTGVAVLGTHTALRASTAAVRGVARYIAWKLAVHNVPATGKARLRSSGGPVSRYPRGAVVRTKRIVGHRRLGLTGCPGDKLNRQLRKVRKLTKRRMKRFANAEPQPTPPPPPDEGSGAVRR
jgi:hypothetical protein